MKDTDLIEGPTPPLEPHGGEARPASPAEWGGEELPTPKEKLVEADRHLLAIGGEVAALRDELSRLGEEANARAELLAEREVVIAELSGLLPTLEDARIQAQRQAEEASAALFRAEARLSEQAARVNDLTTKLATIEADRATRGELIADLQARVAEERAKREGSERAQVDAVTRTQSTERSLAHARNQLQSLFSEHERVLAEHEGERAEARRQVEELAAAARLSESRLGQEKERVEALERELEALEAALARHVTGLSQLEAAVSQVRTEHEEMRTAIAHANPQVAVESPSLDHPRAVFWVGGVWDATSAAVDALLSRSRSVQGKPDVDMTVGDDHTRAWSVSQARAHRISTPSGPPRPQAAMREVGRRLADVLRVANEKSRTHAIRGISHGRHPPDVLPVHSRDRDGAS
jgi:hypothetical protein